MNKIRVRVILTANKDSHIQVSTDNQVWFTIKVIPPVDLEAQGAAAMEEAKALFEVVTKNFALPTHVLWKGNPH